MEAQRQASESANKFNRDSIAAIQRAYLSVQPGRIRDVEIGKKPTVDVLIWNHGKTPAYEVAIWIGIAVGKTFPREPNEEELDKSIDTGHLMYPSALDTKATMMPEIPVPSWTTLMEPLTPDDIAAIQVGTEKIYAAGKITYADAFKCSHTLRYCYVYPSVGLQTEPDNPLERNYEFCAHYNNEKTNCP